MARYLNIVLLVLYAGAVLYFVHEGEAKAAFHGVHSFKFLEGAEAMIGVNSSKPCPSSCDCNPNTWVSKPVRNPDNCNSFCYCVWGRSYWMDCPREFPNSDGRLEFDVTTKECGWSRDVDCEAPEVPETCMD